MSAAVRFVRVVGELPPGFDTLCGEARAEGHGHIDRLVEEWVIGVNRFERDGEVLLAAYSSDVLAGIGGLTHDPSVSDSLRLRRFYVRQAFRRQSVGRAIATALIAGARGTTRKPLTVRAGDELAAAFWEALGFTKVSASAHTHILVLRPMLS